MKTHPDFKRLPLEINEVCPGCSAICNYGFEKQETPEYCEKCGYDLRRPINPIRRFFHNLFWANLSKKYPLAHCRKGYLELKELERSLKK